MFLIISSNPNKVMCHIASSVDIKLCHHRCQPLDPYSCHCLLYHHECFSASLIFFLPSIKKKSMSLSRLTSPPQASSLKCSSALKGRETRAEGEKLLQCSSMQYVRVWDKKANTLRTGGTLEITYYNCRKSKEY